LLKVKQELFNLPLAWRHSRKVLAKMNRDARTKTKKTKKKKWETTEVVDRQPPREITFMKRQKNMT